MSMLALSESECQEILALFRQHLPHVPDAWLQELAANYGQDAIKDIDPNDVIAILAVPGELHRIQMSLAEHQLPEEIYRRMLDERIARDIEPWKTSASMLTIHDSSAKLADVSDLIGRLVGSDPETVTKGWAWYSHTPLEKSNELIWFVIEER